MISLTLGWCVSGVSFNLHSFLSFFSFSVYLWLKLVIFMPLHVPEGAWVRPSSVSLWGWSEGWGVTGPRMQCVDQHANVAGLTLVSLPHLSGSSISCSPQCFRSRKCHPPDPSWGLVQLWFSLSSLNKFISWGSVLWRKLSTLVTLCNTVCMYRVNACNTVCTE